MTSVKRLTILLTVALIPGVFHAFPTIYPTGTTIYHPDKTWNGYTIHPTPENKGVVLVDMNGNVVRRWTEITGGPARILPGGYIVGVTAEGASGGDGSELIQMDWDGNVVWRFAETKNQEGETIPADRLHHDWQRESLPAGYFTLDSEPSVTSGRTLILARKNVTVPEITDRPLQDDYILEVSWAGELLWEWLASDHVGELGFSETALNTIHRNPGNGQQGADWLHFNSLSYLGPNRWYDQGDERFHPDNVIFSSRQANIVGIIARSGDIVWRMGPDYRETEALRAIGQVIGQHHPHIIPVGLPGAGNLMVFDNGGAAGYGASTPAAQNGRNIVERRSSRVLEINPATMEKVWEYSISGHGNFRFFSFNVSSAQRLPNGNTLITEGADGRAFEVTVEGEIVWEYINPFFYSTDDTRHNFYRAYRVPYEWIRQLDRPEERAVIPPHPSEFRIQPQ